MIGPASEVDGYLLHSVVTSYESPFSASALGELSILAAPGSVSRYKLKYAFAGTFAETALMFSPILDPRRMGAMG
jgi:hypothetical protein